MDIPLPIIVYFVALFVLGLFAIYLQQKLAGRKSLTELLSKRDEAIIVTTGDLRIISINNKAKTILSLTADFTGKRIDKLFKNFDKGVTDETFSADYQKSEREKVQIYMHSKKYGVSGKKTAGIVYFLESADEHDQNKNDRREKQKILAGSKSKADLLKKEIEAQKSELAAQIDNQRKNFEAEYAILSASINNLSVGFIMTDDKKRIILWNNFASKIVPILDVKINLEKNKGHLEQISDLLNIQVDKAIKDKKSIILTDMLINSKYLNITISPIFSDSRSETCLGTVIIIEDKQEQHTLEQSKVDLFSIASHELRTPLTAIYGYISLIKQIYFSDLKDDELKQIINNIGVLSKKLSMNINTFLDSSKLEQGKIELKREKCDLFIVVNEAIKETERLSAEKDLYLKLDYPTASITVAGDQLRLIQVVTILLSNAIKFTKVGGIYVKITTDEDFARISIRDTGIGIPEENRILLFSKFQQTVENLLTRQEGTGLGLHLAKLLVEKMGGTIWLEKSELNKGSEFIFTIPLLNKKI